MCVGCKEVYVQQLQNNTYTSNDVVNPLTWHYLRNWFIYFSLLLLIQPMCILKNDMIDQHYYVNSAGIASRCFALHFFSFHILTNTCKFVKCETYFLEKQPLLSQLVEDVLTRFLEAEHKLLRETDDLVIMSMFRPIQWSLPRVQLYLWKTNSTKFYP